MKKTYVLLSLAGALAAPAAHADLTVTLTQDLANYSDSSGGGEFRAVGSADLNAITHGFVGYAASTEGTQGATGPSGGAVGSTYFQTFCIESSEEFSPGTSYSVSTSDSALYNGTGHPVAVTLGVDYLYSQFAKGTLAGYDYTYGTGVTSRTASALALQQAIWYLMGESGGVNNSFVTTAESGTGNAGNLAAIEVAGNGAYNVRAMNLGAPGAVQDQLIVVPEPTTLIAGALLLLPFGASTLRSLRKSRTA